VTNHHLPPVGASKIRIDQKFDDGVAAPATQREEQSFQRRLLSEGLECAFVRGFDLFNRFFNLS